MLSADSVQLNNAHSHGAFAIGFRSLASNLSSSIHQPKDSKISILEVSVLQICPADSSVKERFSPPPPLLLELRSVTNRHLYGTSPSETVFSVCPHSGCGNQGNGGHCWHPPHGYSMVAYFGIPPTGWPCRQYQMFTIPEDAENLLTGAHHAIKSITANRIILAFFHHAIRISERERTGFRTWFE